MVEAPIGPDVILWGCRIFCKPGGDGLEVPWHQDGHYLPIRPLATCTVWLALDRSDVGNGCLRVTPPSAQSGYQVDFSTRPLWLLRGKDRTGKNDFSVGH